MHDRHPNPAASTKGGRLARRLTGAAAIAALLAGCTTPMTYSANFSSDLSSRTADAALAGNASLRALPYFLPKTVLPFTLAGKLSDKRTDADKAKKGSTPKWSYELTLTTGAATQAADGTSPLLLVYNPELATEDHFTLSVNDKQLLATVKSESTDNTPQIITSIADLAGRVAGNTLVPMFGRPKPHHAAPAAKAVDCSDYLKDFAYSGVIDLADPNASQTLNDDVIQAMTNAGAKIDPSTSRLMAVSLLSPAAAAPAATVSFQDVASKARGIVFRAAAPRSFTVSLSPGGIRFPSADAAKACTPDQPMRVATFRDVMVTQPDRYFSIDMTRGALVHKTITLTIADGSLTGIEVQKPSELAALFALPASVIDTFSKAVLGGLTGRTTVTQDQVGYLQQELALSQAREALQAKQTAAATPPATSP